MFSMSTAPTPAKFIDYHAIWRRNIRARRNKLGLSQADVAARLGVVQQIVTRMETGGRIPSLDSIQRFSVALRTTPARLLSPQQNTL